ncbi:hypothetical protein NJF45_09535 [Stenotrophomonas maltophilia]|uniref:hypothetical protein n=1 Tax=Stenotrophomonas TaxID=40323 RepID=UPI00209834F6|nr:MULTISPECIES: hypothetical protein [Stenotrophomonas]MCO7462145.1 hypothetical protein [Stenotrophomonas maltophilia]
MDIESTLGSVRQLRDAIREKNPPPEEGAPSPDDFVIIFSLVRNTRGYIERVVHQINGAYANGWYDACAVMIRRLVETLIIESFERHGISDKIKGTSGDFLFLRDLISVTLAETSWNLSRNTKQALPRLKDVGDLSAHSRRYIAQRKDIDKLVQDLRVVVQELVTVAELKR